VKFRDYYEVLGVGRDASQDEIRKAFRKLARKFHPDTAQDKASAEEKFKEVNEAYEVLGDPEKRKKYDALGANWRHGAEFRPPSGAGPAGGFGGFEGFGGAGGFEFGGTGFSDFFEAFFGGRTRGRRGGVGGGFPDVFRGGAQGPVPGSDVEADLLVTLEEVVRGGERTLTLRSSDGKTRTARVKLPVGVTEGQFIRLAGLGGAGANGGKSGDLFLRVRLERHPDFRVRGNQLSYDLELAPWEAALGTTVRVRTLHGTVQLKIPPGTSSGTELRLKGKGMPDGHGQPGDLHVVVSVVVPPNATPEEKKLWKELERVSGFNPRG
jgi:curved DNA-binding protein